MTSQTRWIENLAVYGDNLSIYYVICAAVSFLAVFFTWRIQRKDPIVFNNKEDEDNFDENLRDEVEGNTEAIKATLEAKKHAKLAKSAILDQVAQSLSSDQLQEEKEMEKQQLENIFELLKQQQDKFQIESIEELQDQMKLYRG